MSNVEIQGSDHLIGSIPLKQSSAATGPREPSTPTIVNLQAMRGIACLLVFIGHAFLLQPGIGFDKMGPYFGGIASSGVDIFFVISGFIISTVAVRSARNGVGHRGIVAWNFGVKRLTRIYPVYWIVFALAVLLSPYIAYSPPQVPREPLIEQALLLTHFNSLIMAAWSLTFEVYFYVIVTAALLISPRRLPWLLALWAAVMSFIIIYGTFVRHEWITAVPTSPLILEFIFGMVIAFLIDRKLMGFAATAIVLGLVGFVVGLEAIRLRGWWTLGPWWRTLGNGLPMAFVLYGVIVLEMKGGWKFAKFWSKFGDASYSIYVWHQFIFYTVLKGLELAGVIPKVPGLILIAGWIVIALAVGFASYRYIEMPIQSRLNGLLLRRVAR
ncbi:acyltransferase family protein [Caballeronia sp. HLA56]